MHVQTTDQQSVIQQISLELNQALQDGSVLWLLSGGSNIGLEVEIRKNLDIQNALTVGLIDERYGPVGHANSNWQQLIDASFDWNDLSTIPTLTGLDFEQEAIHYNNELLEAFESNDCIIGIFGMGTDGHTSGVLPGSTAVHAEELVTFYQGPDYQRITTTPPSFELFDTAYLVAFGDGKHAQLHDLVHKKISINKQPVQALKVIDTFTIFTDQVLSEGL